MMIISHLPGVSRPVFKLVLNEASVGSNHTVGSAQNGKNASPKMHSFFAVLPALQKLPPV